MTALSSLRQSSPNNRSWFIFLTNVTSRYSPRSSTNVLPIVLIRCPVKERRGSASLNMGCRCRVRQSFLQKSSLINVRQAPVSTRECATNDLVTGTSMQTLVSGALTRFPTQPTVSSWTVPGEMPCLPTLKAVWCSILVKRWFVELLPPGC